MQAEKQSGGIGFLNNVEDWRNRAKKIRVIAETILDGGSRKALLQIANDWEWMAQSAEEDLKKKGETIPSGREVSQPLVVLGMVENDIHRA